MQMQIQTLPMQELQDYQLMFICSLVEEKMQLLKSINLSVELQAISTQLSGLMLRPTQVQDARGQDMMPPVTVIS